MATTGKRPFPVGRSSPSQIVCALQARQHMSST
eukprot:CAMPEP_0182876522 /NCGR_PEP_ID=MMETSP0034_2-20130328/14199_1 /TAXON_ID=156128 /ORGANISM="Nephroselmis pyriformis, Strain CCMP717" /LENGTH=32 /DNA_ID= /DNA_START= /DNA_END= /DNA_ORIENTATION=